MTIVPDMSQDVVELLGACSGKDGESMWIIGISWQLLKGLRFTIGPAPIISFAVSSSKQNATRQMSWSERDPRFQA